MAAHNRRVMNVVFAFSILLLILISIRSSKQPHLSTFKLPTVEYVAHQHLAPDL